MRRRNRRNRKAALSRGKEQGLGDTADEGSARCGDRFPGQRQRVPVPVETVKLPRACFDLKRDQWILNIETGPPCDAVPVCWSRDRPDVPFAPAFDSKGLKCGFAGQPDRTFELSAA
jgi:hypothetical protein